MRETSPATRQISAALRSRREELGLSQTAVATFIGRGQTYVSDRDRGLEAWDLDDLTKLASLYKLGSFWRLMEFAGRQDVVADEAIDPDEH
ncbi:helix-turn-helix domain-containing protein [Mumia sp. DW29H23]|uniref:helix-turn-helix domain-containing protein n=1 Tax=Mumia sp. DW29H23 TaxID=3421241 RepID=UPI003D68BB13